MDILNLLTGESHQILLDPEEDLAFDLAVILPQQFEIRKKSSGHRILYGHDRSISRAVIHAHVKFIKGIAFDCLMTVLPVVLIEQTCGLLMKASLNTLNSNFFHTPQNKRLSASTDSPAKICKIF